VLQWFDLSRADFANRFRELSSQKEWCKKSILQASALSHCFRDLYYYERWNDGGPGSLDASHQEQLSEVLHHPQFMERYGKIIVSYPGVNWMEYYEKCETIESERHRHFQPQLVLENLFCPLFLES